MLGPNGGTGCEAPRGWYRLGGTNGVTNGGTAGSAGPQRRWTGTGSESPELALEKAAHGWVAGRTYSLRWNLGLVSSLRFFSVF